MGWIFHKQNPFINVDVASMPKIGDLMLEVDGLVNKVGISMEAVKKEPQVYKVVLNLSFIKEETELNFSLKFTMYFSG